MSFEIDEVVVMRNAGYHTWLNGAFGVVISRLDMRTGKDLNTGESINSLCYRVNVLAEDGRVVQAEPHQLRKLPKLDIQQESDVAIKEPELLEL